MNDPKIDWHTCLGVESQPRGSALEDASPNCWVQKVVFYSSLSLLWYGGYFFFFFSVAVACHQQTTPIYWHMIKYDTQREREREHHLISHLQRSNVWITFNWLINSTTTRPAGAAVTCMSRPMTWCWQRTSSTRDKPRMLIYNNHSAQFGFTQSTLKPCANVAHSSSTASQRLDLAPYWCSLKNKCELQPCGTPFTCRDMHK